MNTRSKHLSFHFFLLVGLWSVAILSLFVMDGRHLRKNIQQLALIEARTYLEKEQANNRWVASHGGVYVPVSEMTQPDPILSQLSERDILTPQDRVGTLMDPAQLMRPYFEHWRKEMTSHAFSLVTLWSLGLCGFWLAASQLSHHMKKKDAADNLLRIAQKNYQALVDNSLTGIYISQDFRIKFCNAKFAEMHGYSLPEMLDKDSKDLVHPLDQAYAVEMHKNRMQGLKVPEDYEIRCITADGRVIWVQRRNSIIMHNGRPAVLGNEIDITQKKISEEALKVSEAQLKRLVARLIRRHEVERKTIALEIHEDIAQTLSAIKMNIEEMLSADPRGSSPEVIAMQPIVERIKDTIQLIRGLTKRLSPIMLDDLGIKTAILTLCTEVTENCKGSKIKTRLDVDEDIIPSELKIVIYRVLEELLALSSRYCMAHHWAVSLTRNNGNIELEFDEIDTNAVQPLEEIEWQMGMAVIHNRAESFGGSLTMRVREENRKTITVSWPMQLVP